MSRVNPYQNSLPQQQQQRPISYTSEPDYGDSPLEHPTYNVSAAGGVVPIQQTRTQNQNERPISILQRGGGGVGGGIASTPYTSYDIRDEKPNGGGRESTSIIGGLEGTGFGVNRPISEWTIPPPPKSTGILRMWRKENRASWVKVSGWVA
jgi:hypothetical protein